MRVREALPDDSAALAELLTDLGYPSDGPAVRERLHALRDASRVLVAEDGGSPAGVIASHHLRVLEDDRPVCLVIALVVATGARRRGVGRLLLEAVEQEARAAGCGRMVVGAAHHRADAHAFYRERGFAETGLRFQKRLV